MITGIIKLLSTGIDTGPFYIYSNVDGFTTAFLGNISKASLLAGYPTDLIPNNTTVVRVKSLNDICNNYVDIVLPIQSCYNFLPENTTYLLSQVIKSNTGYFYGFFTGYEETGVPTTSHDLVKLNIDLTIDTSFNVGVGFDQILYSGSSIVEQSDGKIIATGTFTTYQGVSANRIIRLNTDGTRDNTFVIGTGFNDFTQKPAIDSLGRILVTGIWSNYNGYSANRLIRLNPDGTVDPSLVTGTGFNSTTVDVLVNPDNSMYVTGYFSSYNGVTANGMVKLNPDGTVDNTFVVGAGLVPHGAFQPTHLSRITGQSSFFAVGVFTTYKGVPEAHIIKIDQYGNKDMSFDTGTGFDNEANIIHTVWENKLFITGDFENYNGTSAFSGLIILNEDGTVLYSEPSLDYYNTPIIIGNNLFASKTGGCMELLYTYVPVAPTTTTTTTLPITTTTTTTIPGCVQVLSNVIAPTPQTGPNNYYGAEVSLSVFPLLEDVTITGYIKDDTNGLNTQPFSIIITAGLSSGQTANNILTTAAGDTATVFITNVTPGSVTYSGNSYQFCPYI